ncbi:MAG: glycosyltransferase, partial [bacterium]
IHEQTGLLVDERSPEGIAGAVMRIQHDMDLAKELTKKGRYFVERQYSKSASATHFSRVFKDICQPVAF